MNKSTKVSCICKQRTSNSFLFKFEVQQYQEKD